MFNQNVRQTGKDARLLGSGVKRDTVYAYGGSPAGCYISTKFKKERYKIIFRTKIVEMVPWIKNG